MNTSHDEPDDTADDTQNCNDMDQSRELQLDAITRQQDQGDSVQSPVLLDGWNHADIRPAR